MKLRALMIVLALPASLGLLTAGLIAQGFVAHAQADRSASDLTLLRHELNDTGLQRGERIFLPNAPSGVQVAMLQSLLTDMADLAGVTLLRLDALPGDSARRASVLSTVRARMQIAGTEAQIMEAIIAVESAEPFAFIEVLSIQPTSEGALEAQVSVVAYGARLTTP